MILGNNNIRNLRGNNVFEQIGSLQNLIWQNRLDVNFCSSRLSVRLQKKFADKKEFL